MALPVGELTRADVVALWGRDRDALRDCGADKDALVRADEARRAEINGH